MLDISREHLPELSASTLPKKTRKKRINVTGAPGWQINSDGDVFHLGHRVKLSGGRAPLIDFSLGDEYAGPVWPAYGDGSCARFLDEIVAWEYHGPAPAPWRYVSVLHRDNDLSNCGAANLVWMVDAQWAEENVRSWMKSHLRACEAPDGIVKGAGAFRFAPTRKRAPQLPDYLPSRPRITEPPPRKVAQWDALYADTRTQRPESA